MNATGLVAFIITVHEAAAILAVLVGCLVASIGTLLMRHAPPGRRLFAILAFAVGSALLTLAVSARVFSARALDVEVVRVNG